MLQFFLRYFGSFLVSISTVALLFVLYSLGIFSDVNRSWTDNLYDSGDSSANIVIVGIDSKSMDELGRWPRPRSEFAKLVNQLSQAEAVGINVSFFDQFDIDGSQQFAVALRSSNNVVLRSIVSEFGSVDGQEGLVIKDETFPVELLQENARAVGYTNVFFDDDGVCRKFFVNLKGRSKSFAEEIYKLYLNRDFSHAESSLFIDYKGGSGSYEIYSFVDVVNGKFKKDFWENKIVLVGSTTPEIHDIYNVPTAKNSGMYGVEVQANIIQTLISRNFLKVQNDLSLFWIMLGGAMVTGLLVLTFRLKTSTALSLL